MGFRNSAASLVASATGIIPKIVEKAVIRTGRGNRVLLALGDGRFRAQPVVMGLVSGQHVEIISGVEQGQAVVTSAQFLLDSEASQEAEFERMDGEDPS